MAFKDNNDSQLTHDKGLWHNGFVYFDLHLKHILNFLRKYEFLGTFLYQPAFKKHGVFQDSIIIKGKKIKL